MSKPIFTDVAIDLLNEALKLDHEAIASLFDEFVFVNKGMADHPTIVCREEKSSWTGKEHSVLGFLGLLNGIIDKAGYPLVAAKYSNEGKLIGFCHYDDKNLTSF